MFLWFNIKYTLSSLKTNYASFQILQEIRYLIYNPNHKYISKKNLLFFLPFFQVKVLLRVNAPPEGNADSSSILGVDRRRKQVSLFHPISSEGAPPPPEDRRLAVSAPKMFAFDAIFSQDDSQVRLCHFYWRRPWNRNQWKRPLVHRTNTKLAESFKRLFYS